jgi:hypothetical protein
MEQTLGSSSDDRLERPVLGGIALNAEERRTVDLAGRIAGWGSDLDPARRPGVPRDAAPGIGIEALYPPITAQVTPHRIHKSTEHGKLTPVFGTSCPPRGLSGRIRDYAYRLSEGRVSRWMALLFADRVDMVEGVASDFVRLQPPNIVREMGLRSEWKYNKKHVLTVAAAATVSIAALYLLSRSTRRR